MCAHTCTQIHVHLVRIQHKRTLFFSSFCRCRSSRAARRCSALSRCSSRRRRRSWSCFSRSTLAFSSFSSHTAFLAAVEKGAPGGVSSPAAPGPASVSSKWPCLFLRPWGGLPPAWWELPLLSDSPPQIEGHPEDGLRPQNEGFPSGRPVSPPLASWSLGTEGETSSFVPDPRLTLGSAVSILMYCD